VKLEKTAWWRASWFVLLLTYYSGCAAKENVMGRSCFADGEHWYSDRFL